MKHVIAKLDFDEGLSFCGPFNTKFDATNFMEVTGMHTDVHCEVLEVHPRECHADFYETGPTDEPHVILTGTLAGGYKVYGPYPSLEAAESVGDGLPEYANLMPLDPLAY